MKFKAQAGGLLAGIKPLLAVATKGTQDDYPQVNLITLTAVLNAVQGVADGGLVKILNEIGNDNYNLDYVCEEDGVATVNASDLYCSLDSFPPSSVLTIKLDNVAGGRSLVISDSNDESQSLPVHDNHCEYNPPEPDKKGKSVSITLRRDMFISYANKIAFAQGEMEQFKQYTYWVMRAIGPDHLRFAAGSGNRFAVVDLEGSNLNNSKNTVSILFPNEQSKALLSVLGGLRCEDIVIEPQSSFINITCGKTKLCILNVDPSISWPDENKLLERTSKFMFTTKVANWKGAIKGIVATNNDEQRKQNQVHGCSLSIDLAKKLIQTKADAVMKSSRKVSIDDFASNEAEREFEILCTSVYLNEILSKSGDETYLQFEVDGVNSPVVVRFYSSQNVGDPKNFVKATDDGIKERYSVLFSTIKKPGQKN